jgi:ribonuclease HII
MTSVNDSKKLSHRARLAALEHIRVGAACLHTAMASHRTVDRLK